MDAARLAFTIKKKHEALYHNFLFTGPAACREGGRAEDDSPRTSSATSPSASTKRCATGRRWARKTKPRLPRRVESPAREPRLRRGSRGPAAEPPRE